MKKATSASAPGKLMLLGEHAVVYNRPCLMTAINQRMYAAVEMLDIPELQLEAAEVNVTGYRKSFRDIGRGDIPKGAIFIETALRNLGEKHPLEYGIRVTTSSEISPEFGFGSSSASTVCALKAISELFDLHLSQREIFDIAYKTVLDVQGKGSGYDVAAGVYGGTLYFVTGGRVIEPLNIDELPLIVGYSGIKAVTVTLINLVKEKADCHPEVIEGIFNTIEKLVELAKNGLMARDWPAFGELMNFNQGYLAALGVSTRKLADMIYAARGAGAYGAKLSGAGGGDCMIAVASDDKKEAVANAIAQAGGKVIPVVTNAQGVRIEQ